MGCCQVGWSGVEEGIGLGPAWPMDIFRDGVVHMKRDNAVCVCVCVCASVCVCVSAYGVGVCVLIVMRVLLLLLLRGSMGAHACCWCSRDMCSLSMATSIQTPCCMNSAATPYSVAAATSPMVVCVHCFSVGT